MVAAQHALDIAVEDGSPHSAAERENGACCRAPDAGKFAEPRDITWEGTLQLVADNDGAAMQIAGPGVIAKTGPVMQYLVERRGGQRVHIREVRHETLKIGNDGVDLSLLQHDFRDPHAIGRRVLLPWQMMASAVGKPVQNAVGEGAAWHRRGSLA
jgi:hypothetical protein